jgi:hypothetical protein
MRFHLKGNKVIAIALVLSLLGASPASGQAAQPEWAADLFVDLEVWTDDYNAHVDELTLVERSLLGKQSVAVYIRDADGAEAAYWFRTDSEARITELQQGVEDREVTLRLATTKVVFDRIAAAPDPLAAFRQALQSGQIGVKKLLVLYGTTIAVGPVEALAGTAGVLAGAVALTKVGLGGVVSVPKAAASRLVGRVRWAFRAVRAGPAAIRGFVNDLLMAVSVLDLVGVDVKGKVRAFLRVLFLPFVWIGKVIRRSPPEEEGVSEREQRSPR